MVRSTFGRIVLLLTAMTAVEAAAFAALTLRGPTEKGFGLEPILQKSGAVWIFGAAALLMTLLLCRTGSSVIKMPIFCRFSPSCRYKIISSPAAKCSDCGDSTDSSTIAAHTEPKVNS